MPAPKSRVLPRNFHVRRATLRDITVLVEHRRRMWEDIRKDPPTTLEKGSRYYRQWLRTRLQDKRIVGFIVIGPDHHPVASGLAMLYELDPPPWGGLHIVPHLISVYTEPSYRRKGFASAVVKSLVQWARSEGYVGVTLSPAKNARRLYAQLGFKRSWTMGRSSSK
jgi:GNAT superfamily N-acetyltransferase